MRDSQVRRRQARSHPAVRTGVLLVCTGNVCRSPAAEALLRAALAEAAPRFEVWSAGTDAVVGAGLHELTAAALRRHGRTVPRHRARPLVGDDVRGAALVLCASRRQRTVVVDQDPAAVKRTFTVVEFARIADRLLAEGVRSLPAVLERAAELRADVAAGDPGALDIADPVRGGQGLHDDTVAALAVAMGPISQLLMRASTPPAP